MFDGQPIESLTGVMCKYLLHTEDDGIGNNSSKTVMDILHQEQKVLNKDLQ